MSTESVYNLLQDLCRHHLKVAGNKSGKVKFHTKKLHLLCYQILLTNVKHNKEEGVILNSYEKLLSHAADMNIKGAHWKAQRLDILTLKLLTNAGAGDVKETLNVFSLLVLLLNTGTHTPPSCKELKFRGNYLNGSSDLSYSQYNESDFSFIPSDCFQYELDYNNNKKEEISKSFAPSDAFSSYESSNSMWELTSKLINHKRYSWEELGRCDILIERPFITELPATKIVTQLTQFTPSLVNDVVKLLVGVPSKLFQWNEDKFFFVQSNKNEGPILGNVCKDFLEIGNCFKKLTEFTCKFSKCLASVQGAFGKALEDFLFLYSFFVSSINKNCYSFAQIKFRYRKIFKQLRYLKKFCETLFLHGNAGTSVVNASDLLGKLYENCLMVEGDDDLKQLSIFLFKSACCPYFKMLQDWVYQGACPDDDNQFMITSEFFFSTCKDDYFWTKGFALENVPCFLRNVAEVILTCGKSLNLLKLCCDQHYLTCNRSDTSQLRPPIDFAMTNSSLKLYQNNCKVYLDQVLIKRSEESYFQPVKNLIDKNEVKQKNDSNLQEDDKVYSSFSGSENNSPLHPSDSSKKSRISDEVSQQNAFVPDLRSNSESCEQLDVVSKVQNELHGDNQNSDVPCDVNLDIATQLIMTEDDSETLHHKQSDYILSNSPLHPSDSSKKLQISNEVSLQDELVPALDSDSGSCEQLDKNGDNQNFDGFQNSDVPCDENLDFGAQLTTEDDSETLLRKQSDYIPCRKLVADKHVGMESDIWNNSPLHPSDSSKKLLISNEVSLQDEFVSALDQNFDIFQSSDVPCDENLDFAAQLTTEKDSETLLGKQSDDIPRRKLVVGKHVGMESDNFKVFSQEDFNDASHPEMSGRVLNQHHDDLLDNAYMNESGCHSEEFLKYSNFKVDENSSCDVTKSQSTNKVESPSTACSITKIESQSTACSISKIESDVLQSRNSFKELFDFDCFDTNIFRTKTDEVSKKAVNESATDVEDSIMFSIWVKESLFHSIKIQAFLVDQALLDYFLHTIKMHEYFDVFQKYILLQDGHFATSLVEQLSNKFHSVKSTSFVGLQGSRKHEVFNPAYLNSILQKILSTGSTNRSKSSLDVSNRLTFVISRNSREVSNPDETDPLGFLHLTAVLDWPACIVIQKKHMQAYHSLFAFLFKIKRVMWSLNEIYINLKRDASIFNGGKRFHEQYQILHLFRHNMQHFAQVIQDYISNQVMAVSWQEFQNKLNSSLQGQKPRTQPSPVKNLDSLIRSHSEFIEKCTSRCLLNKNSSSVLSVINSILCLIFLFHDQLNSEPWATMEVDGNVEVFHPKFEILLKTHMKFQQGCTFLLRVLSKLEEKWQRPHIQELLLRLNFNYAFFKNN